MLAPSHSIACILCRGNVCTEPLPGNCRTGTNADRLMGRSMKYATEFGSYSTESGTDIIYMQSCFSNRPLIVVAAGLLLEEEADIALVIVSIAYWPAQGLLQLQSRCVLFWGIFVSTSNVTVTCLLLWWHRLPVAGKYLNRHKRCTQKQTYSVAVVCW
jgi:hypothetical protein